MSDESNLRDDECKECEHLNCCDCGIRDDGCGCRYCWSCYSCDDCYGE